MDKKTIKKKKVSKVTNMPNVSKKKKLDALIKTISDRNICEEHILKDVSNFSSRLDYLLETTMFMSENQEELSHNVIDEYIGNTLENLTENFNTLMCSLLNVDKELINDFLKQQQF